MVHLDKWGHLTCRHNLISPYELVVGLNEIVAHIPNDLILSFGTHIYEWIVGLEMEMADRVGSILPPEYLPRDPVRAAKIGKLYTFVVTQCPHSIF